MDNLAGPAIMFVVLSWFLFKMTAGCGCQYIDAEGIARITAIENAPSYDWICTKDPVIVTYEVEFAYGEIAPGYEMRTPGGNPYLPRAWVESEGIEVGSEYHVKINEMVTGSCSGSSYTFSELSFDTAETCMTQ